MLTRDTNHKTSARDLAHTVRSANLWAAHRTGELVRTADTAVTAHNLHLVRRGGLTAALLRRHIVPPAVDAIRPKG